MIDKVWSDLNSKKLIVIRFLIKKYLIDFEMFNLIDFLKKLNLFINLIFICGYNITLENISLSSKLLFLTPLFPPLLRA